MSIEQSQIESLLRNVHLFSLLDNRQITWVARQFDEKDLKPGARLILEGESSKRFLVVLQGELSVSHTLHQEESAQLKILVPGDFYGEEALIFNQSRPVIITAITFSRLFFLDRERFRRLIEEIPQVRTLLLRDIESRHLTSQQKFDWLNDDEVIYQVCRKHIAQLILVLIIPAVLCLLAIGSFIFGIFNFSNELMRNTSLIMGFLILLAGLGWGIWCWIDWGNDRYIITNQRVVWIEKVVWLYESRIEAPLNTITAVNVTVSYLGRLLGYGDVVVTTYVGKVPLRVVSNPYQMAALVEEYWHRSQTIDQRIQKDELQRAIDQITKPGEEIVSNESKAPSQVDAWTLKELTRWEKYFGNIFKMRFEQGNVITYRKHWLILLRKTFRPLLTGFVIIVGISLYTTLFASNTIRYLSPLVLILIGIALFGFVVIPWWLYNYVDWRNDIYQLTEESIFDIERKPFGTEVKKSASLKNVLSLEHERPGFLGYLFNVGTVTINVGDSKLLFSGVHEPTRIQQDIFNHMYMLRMKKDKDEIARERDRILSLLEIYHQETEDHNLGN
jgi:hypothetical protein